MPEDEELLKAVKSASLRIEKDGRLLINYRLMKIDWRKIEKENQGLSVRSASSLDEGWNARAYLVNHGLVFRFPKRQDHWEELEREITFLAFAAADLPLAVPWYENVSPNSHEAPCGYAVYRYLCGEAMDANALSRETQAAAAEAIATFLRALHSLQPSPAVNSILPGRTRVLWRRSCMYRKLRPFVFSRIYE